MTSTVLLVAPHFPPSTLASVHRARLIAKHLPEHGWRPIVVRVDERFYTEPGDPALAELVPADLEQVRTGALPAPLCRLFGVGDIGLRAYAHLRGAVDRLIASEQPAAVFISGFPFYPMGLAGRISRRAPVVLDFIDPWVSANGATQPFGSKAWLSHRLAMALEPRALRHAAFVTSVSEVHNGQMAARYPWLDPDRMAAIPFGGDPDDFTALRARPAVGADAYLDPAKINFSYVGAFLPRSPPLARRLFAALALVRREAPQLAERLRLNFFGASNQPGGAGIAQVLPIAETEGVADLVREWPRRVPYLHALTILAKSNAILLIGSDEPHYTASKIYPALMSGTPYLSIFHAASSAHRILTEAGGGRAIAFADEAELQASVPALAEAIIALATSPGTFGAVRPDAIAPYTAHATAGAFADVFERAGRP